MTLRQIASTVSSSYDNLGLQLSMPQHAPLGGAVHIEVGH